MRIAFNVNFGKKGRRGPTRQTGNLYHAGIRKADIIHHRGQSDGIRNLRRSYAGCSIPGLP